MTDRARFGDTLARRVAERNSQIVLGLDPDPRELWPGLAPDGGAGATPAELCARAVLAQCVALIDAAGAACVGVKLQLARFEVLGAPGWDALARAAQHARAAGLLVIADGKRGDIDVSAGAYAAALGAGLQTPFGDVPGLAADLVTVNPLMGSDALAPFVAAARERGSGVLVLVRTSNPGAADIEDLPLREGASVWERIAALVDELGAEGRGDAGLSDVGAVMGATQPHHLARARELMPAAPFLLPGVGAQGGRVEDLAEAFAAGPAGALITASRSIAQAHVRSGADPASAARAAAEELRGTAWTLSQLR